MQKPNNPKYWGLLAIQYTKEGIQEIAQKQQIIIPKGMLEELMQAKNKYLKEIESIICDKNERHHVAMQCNDEVFCYLCGGDNRG